MNLLDKRPLRGAIYVEIRYFTMVLLCYFFKKMQYCYILPPGTSYTVSFPHIEV